MFLDTREKRIGYMLAGEYEGELFGDIPEAKALIETNNFDEYDQLKLALVKDRPALYDAIAERTREMMYHC